ncbi:MAG TPA: hypothetical protein DEB09_05160 [Candidatus Magasanikbacteria bacterium]|nr:hypothetical protein [Candidatus Magasanikbacteria bacterium]
MQEKTALKELGLNEHEAEVYLGLLKIGGSIASAVAKSVGIKRTTVYALLKSLAEKGFVTTYYRKSKQFFYAEKPQRVADYFEKKLDAFNNLVPVLESMEKKKLQMGGLRFIETVHELKKFYTGVLNDFKNKSYYVIGSVPNWEKLDAEWFVRYRKDRAQAGIHTKLLITAESKKINPPDIKLLRSYKYLPAKYKFKSSIDIFKDKILVVSPELSSLAVVIAVPAMVDVFRSVFEMLWDTLPE